MSRALGAWAVALSDLTAGVVPALAWARVDSERSHNLHRQAARRVLDDFGIEMMVEDRSDVTRRPRDRGVLFVHLDQQTLLSAAIYPLVLPLPFRLVVNAEFAALPLVGWLALAHGAVPILRQRPAQARRALARVSRAIRQGHNFGISIEGRRSPDGELSPYKKGPAVIAIDAQCDIVPFMSHGEWSLWPHGDWRIRPGRIHCVVYPAISTQGMRYGDRDALVARLRELAENERKARLEPFTRTDRAASP
ncbi:MAG TPA: lysophospholipid acyltransferase family protein [Labilithrix sp.]|nr:lysophospholipid acyltransferase family protein [Labilithrix sp.]